MSAKLLTGNETFSYTISTPPPEKNLRFLVMVLIRSNE